MVSLMELHIKSKNYLFHLLGTQMYCKWWAAQFGGQQEDMTSWLALMSRIFFSGALILRRRMHRYIPGYGYTQIWPYKNDQLKYFVLIFFSFHPRIVLLVFGLPVYILLTQRCFVEQSFLLCYCKKYIIVLEKQRHSS